MELKETLLESETVETYSELFIRYHLADLSNISEQKDSDRLLVVRNYLNESSSNSKSSYDKSASIKDLYAIIKEKDNEIAKLKEIITELSELMNKQNEDVAIPIRQTNQPINIQEEEQKICSTFEKAQEMYNQIKRTETTFDEKFCYKINMEDNNDLEILDYTSQATFPYINELEIGYPPCRVDLKLQKLLKCSFHNSLKHFSIYWHEYSECPINDYIDVLTAIISRTTTEVKFAYPTLNYDELSAIVKASKHINKLVFHGLKLHKTGKIDFGSDLDYKIKVLSFQWSGEEVFCNWKKDKTEFDTIYIKIKKSELHKNLKTLDLYNCGIDTDGLDFFGVLIIC